jgi:uncharacterized PurR-regulated membrane protein YhhQ (DUF165 family)
MNQIQQRRDFVFLFLSSIFLACMVMLNILGITRFVQVGWFQVAVGVLPYPITFICTDLICEFYGRERANQLVFIGFITNLLLLAIMYLAVVLPSVPTESLPPWQYLELGKEVFLPNSQTLVGKTQLYDLLFATTSGAVAASMVAYLLAQLCDVRLFHFWKKLTNGKHLWLRNNGSTVISQFVDTLAVIAITFGAAIWAGKMELGQAGTLFWGSYSFKICVALFDTVIVYACVRYLTGFLKIDPSTVE